MIATAKSFGDMVNLLLQYNVDVDLQNRNGDTALYYILPVKIMPQALPLTF